MFRVLIVDDEPHVTRLVQQRLRSEGYEAVTASNGMAALALLEEQWPFHAIVTDYNMPKMDGQQLCTAVRERFSGERIAIYLVTARIDDPLRDWAEGLPRVEYMEKPLSLQDLISRLAKEFADRGAADEDEV